MKVVVIVAVKVNSSIGLLFFWAHGIDLYLCPCYIFAFDNSQQGSVSGINFRTAEDSNTIFNNGFFVFLDEYIL